MIVEQNRMLSIRELIYYSYRTSNIYRIATSYMTLLWSLFSITKVEDTEVAEPYAILILFITYFNNISVTILHNGLVAACLSCII